MAESSATGANKRRRESSSPRPGPAKKAKADKAQKKKRRNQTGADQHRMKKIRVPDGARELVRAFYLHLRILWCLVVSLAVPRLPDAADVLVFDQRWASIDDVMVQRNSPHTTTPSNDDLVNRLVQLRADHKSTSTTAKQASRVPDSALTYALGMLAKYGLRSWRPNFHEDAYSLYNSTHRIIAIDTFRQLTAATSYDFLGVDKSYINDTLLLTQAYDHFVHQYMYDRWRKEMKYPGSICCDRQRLAPSAAIAFRFIAASPALPGRYTRPAGLQPFP